MTATALLHPSATALALASALALAGCDQSQSLPSGAPQAGADAPDPGYRAPPRLDGFKTADGGLSLSGHASPSSKVRLTSLAGVQVETTADGGGVWTAPLGPVSEPTLYNLAEETPGRSIPAEGLIAVLPGAPTVALLRAGDGAHVMRGQAATGLKILAIDYDGGGGAVVSGVAPGGGAVRVSVDGQPAIDGAARSDGRFSLVLPKPLEPGLRRLQAQTAKAAAEVAVPITPPAGLKGVSYQASRQSYGWRIDWMTASGGAQTTLLPGA